MIFFSVSSLKRRVAVRLHFGTCPMTSLILCWILFIYRALGNAIPFYKTMGEGCAAAYRIFELIKRNPPIDADDMSGQMLERVQGNLELRNVDFAYPTRPDVPILQKFRLKIPAGTSTFTSL